MLIEWILFIGIIAALISPLFVGIAFDETDPKGYRRACACALACWAVSATAMWIGF